MMRGGGTTTPLGAFTPSELDYDMDNTKLAPPWALPLLALSATLALTACGPEGSKPGQDFISDDPQGSEGGAEGGGDTDNAGSTAGGDEGGQSDTGGDDGGDEGGGDAVEVLEADIIQMEGDTLYALSRYSGLSVVDMADPDDLDVLGTWETDAEPFEMYVDAGQAFVMFNDHYFWSWDDALGYWEHHSTSRLVALDASNPADIQMTGEFTLPGRIQDSRRVGDILYVVTLQDGYCWNCDETQNTRITSLDISNPSDPQVIDALVFEAPDQSWDWQRSVESTTERMYVAARTWGGEGQGSLIDVVDISAGDGTLTQGAQVQVEGEVFSRWQMDEHEGVFRVISQFQNWDVNPKIETFTIENVDTYTPLGEGELTLPMPESLRSVRYDGDRAYAITAEQTDPLFTIDLSDPAAPQQIGELEIPGWVYHMETRGDRILALGFDQAHPEGSINVSLFDVSTFDAPQLRKRVHFGGDWAQFAEDQNRIHKAFTILDDEEMLLIPFSGWIWDEDGSGEFCNGAWAGGVQIIDWMNDDLTLRGLIPARGSARRAFTHRERVVTVSDMELATYDYADRDMPVEADKAALAVQVDGLVKAGDHWVRLARDWYTNEGILEVVDASDPGAPEPIGTIDLNSVISDETCEYSWLREIYGRGDHVFALYDVQGEDLSQGGYDWYSYVRLVAVDISNPAEPKLAGTLQLDGHPGWGYDHLANVSLSSSWAVQQGENLVLLLGDSSYESESVRVQVVDLSNPDELSISATLERPTGQTQGSLSVFSDTVVSWHTEPVEGQAGKVRFYLDRLDLNGTPEWKSKINVPGVVVAYDESAGRAYTVDFVIEEQSMTPDQCWAHPKMHDFVWPEDSNYDYNDVGTCKLIYRNLKRVSIEGSGAYLEQTLDIEGDYGLRQLEATGERIFANVGWYEYGWLDGVEEEGDQDVDHSEFVLIDIDADEAVLERRDGSDFGYWWNFVATQDHRAIVRHDYGQLTLIDANDVEAPQISTTQLPGYGGCYDAVITDTEVYCPMGHQGLATVEW